MSRAQPPQGGFSRLADFYPVAASLGKAQRPGHRPGHAYRVFERVAKYKLLE